MNLLSKLIAFTVIALGPFTNVYSQKITAIYDNFEDCGVRCRLTLDDHSRWFYSQGGVGGLPKEWKEGHEAAILVTGENPPSFALKNMETGETCPVQFYGFSRFYGDTSIVSRTRNSLSLSNNNLYLPTTPVPGWELGDKILACSSDGSKVGDLLYNDTKQASVMVSKPEWLAEALYTISTVDPTWGETVTLDNGVALQIYNEDVYDRWFEGDQIVFLMNDETAYFGDHHFYNYRILNLRTAEEVLCYILDADESHLLPVEQIDEFFEVEPEGSLGWSQTDRVMIGLNNGEGSDEYPYILINIDASQYGQSRKPEHTLVRPK